MKKIFFLILAVILTAGQTISQKYVSDKQLSDEERLAWWHEARFGMFIHWGVYAMYAGQYNGYEQAR